MGILMETTQVNLGTAGYRRRRAEPELFGAMGTPSDYFADTLHTIAINTRETEFGSIVEPIPITLTTYKHFQAQAHSINGHAYPQQQVLSSLVTAPNIPEVGRPSTSYYHIAAKEEIRDETVVRPPPKKKWIKEYLEEEPKSPVSVHVVNGLPLPVTARSNGVVRALSPLPAAPPCPPVPPAVALEPLPTAPGPAPVLDFVQEHSRPRTTSSSHGLPQIPSPPSVSSNGSSSSNSNSSVPRAGTREVHNKLEKNRRAHLKECFELLKRHLPATPDDKKTSNLSILGSAIRYIQVLRRKERECEHEMERLAREKIAAQQRLAALKREVSIRASAVRPRSIDPTDDKEREETVINQVLGIPISITSSPPRPVSRMEVSPPHTLNLSTKLRTLPIQITPTTSQVVRTVSGSRHSTLTLTTLSSADHSTQNGQPENGLTNTLGTLVHPAQIHLPITQVVGSGGLVVGPGALQLLSTSGGLRVLQTPLHTNGITGDISRTVKENGLVSPTPVSKDMVGGNVLVNGLPLVVAPPARLMHHHAHTHTLTHKMVETQMVKNSTPLTVSAQYLSATTIMKPVVVVSSAATAPAPAPAPASSPPA